MHLATADFPTRRPLVSSCPEHKSAATWSLVLTFLGTLSRPDAATADLAEAAKRQIASWSAPDCRISPFIVADVTKMCKTPLVAGF